MLQFGRQFIEWQEVLFSTLPLPWLSRTSKAQLARPYGSRPSISKKNEVRGGLRYREVEVSGTPIIPRRSGWLRVLERSSTQPRSVFCEIRLQTRAERLVAFSLIDSALEPRSARVGSYRQLPLFRSITTARLIWTCLYAVRKQIRRTVALSPFPPHPRVMTRTYYRCGGVTHTLQDRPVRQQ